MVTDNQSTFPGFQFPNTTQIPNEVFDTLMPQLSGGELKVLLYICRRTFGFRKGSDRISLTQIAHGITTKGGRVLDQGTGLSKRHVINALKALEKKNIIIITRTVDETGLNEVNTYSLNMPATGREGETTVHHGVVQSSSSGVVNESSPGVVNASAPTKQREQKKEEQKKDVDDDVVAHDLENFGMTKSAVTALMQRYPAMYIKEKLLMAQGLVAAGSALVAKNPVGWLRRAIEEDYQPPRNTVRPTQPTGTKSQESKGIHEEQKREQNSITPPVELPQPDSQTEMIWQKTVEQLKEVLPRGEAETRLTGTTLLKVTDITALICAPAPTARVWLERRLYQQIRCALKGIIGTDVDLQFVTNPV
jgi:phage replication O-like protein O